MEKIDTSSPIAETHSFFFPFSGINWKNKKGSKQITSNFFLAFSNSPKIKERTDYLEKY